MSAFNWVKFEAVCPICSKKSEIVSQTHMCSDYDGDDTGRFHDRTYCLGMKMAWWCQSDQRFSAWADSNAIKDLGYDSINECCYSECSECKSDLYVVLKFIDRTPVKVLEIGRESDWPMEYYK